MNIQTILKEGRGTIGRYIINVTDDKCYKALNIISEDGKAFLRLSLENDNTTFIVYVSVANDTRRCGEANKIIEFAEDISRVLGCNKISLMVDTTNWIYEWYKRKGFQDDFKDSHLILTKTIKK